MVKKKGRRQKAEGRRYKTIQWKLDPSLIEDHQPRRLVGAVDSVLWRLSEGRDVIE
ncbi:MAG: hypothetical protein DSM106950_04470 [Stigonema ocellatum SAG 48.90 = DSM 106950]|nr:hypothetical protein [Stigonema ocellatum SAG 48.90 = DSM 106950]